VASKGKNSAGKRGKKSRGSGVLPVAMLALVLVVLVGVSVFFRVSDIQVEGSSVYTPEAIIAASGLEKGDNIFLLRVSEAVLAIRTGMPYVDEIKIEPTLPGTVTITITESKPAAQMSYGAKFLIFDKNGRILEISDAKHRDCITVSGLIANSAAAGEKLKLGIDADNALSSLSELLCAIDSLGIQSDVTWIDMSELSNISFDYKEIFTVRMGSSYNAVDKLTLLMKSAEYETQPGRFDISIENEAHFMP